MKNDRSPTITRRAFVQRAAIILGSLITASCSANKTAPDTATAVPSLTPTVKPAPVATPSIAPSDAFDHVLFVNISDPNADDANPGTENRPLKTIAKAADLAVQNNLRNTSTRVVMYPGVYRESISVQSKTSLSNAPIQFEAKEHGTAKVAGSDVWTGWKKQGTTNTYTHMWPYKWGVEPYPDGWEGNVVVQPIVRRREMIFIDGQSLTQVASNKELKEGTFFVSEQTATVSLVPPPQLKVETSTVEVAVRPRLFIVESAQNLTVQGLVFIHGNTPIGDTAVIFSNCSNVLVEDCGFLWCNWSGMTFTSSAPHSSHSMTARRNVANYNGAIGLEASRVKDLLYEDNETSYNNWRGALGDLYSWSNGGMKHLFIHGGVYRRHRAVSNQAPGCWFDTDCANIEIDRAYCSRNYIGIFIEASEGPTSVTNSTIVNSTSDGIFSEGGDNVTLQGNIIYGSAAAQIHVLTGIRPVDNWETKESLKLVSERWTLRKNTIVGTNTAPHLVQIGNSAGTNRNLFLSTLMSDENVWFSPKNGEAFDVNHRALDFNTWQSSSKQDVNSRFIDPHINPNNETPPAAP